MVFFASLLILTIGFNHADNRLDGLSFGRADDVSDAAADTGDDDNSCDGSVQCGLDNFFHDDVPFYQFANFVSLNFFFSRSALDIARSMGLLDLRW